MNSTWIDVDINPSINLQTFNCCTALVDVHGDRDNKFAVVDFGSGTSNPQLRVFKGLNQSHVIFLNDKPSAIIVVYTDYSEHHVPCIAVVIKNEIYFYRNCKPYHKYTVQPTVVNDDVEKRIWREAKESADLLKNLRVLANTVGFASLSTTSQHALCCDEYEVDVFFEKYKNQKLVKQPNITCIAELKRKTNEPNGVSCLVIATTDKITIMDTESFKILSDKYELQGETVYLATVGLYDVDYKILVATRTGRLYIFSKSSTSGYKVEMTHAIVAVVLRVDKFVCCTVDGLLQCYTLKCASLWNVELPGDPTAMVNMYVQSMSLELTVVACTVTNVDGHIKGSILVYSGSTVVHKITMPDPIYCVTFGKFGQEENALLMISSKGKLDVKLLKRTATFDLCPRTTVIARPSITLNIPKRSNVFIEQTLRERECFNEMHVRTQQSWRKFQIKLLSERINSIKQKITNQFLHTSVQLLGLGPRFKIRFNLKNLGDKYLDGVDVAFLYNPQFYIVETACCKLPVIIPDKEVSCETFITCCAYGGTEERAIDIVVNRSTTILYRAKLNMPVYNQLSVNEDIINNSLQ
ncbi:Bardet-Biedl syndrome 1 protein homolog [Adelges cooleyi]|uniref:Bardet-Biedl syndrome 1 protein homolog n=1 Tax=Adelges cooleyi TaxID=133065 RepID=UPI00218057CA|nr:Bardet-Biedl syndrome 1 protein homolog [Adelges cooleyi]